MGGTYEGEIFEIIACCSLIVVIIGEVNELSIRLDVKIAGNR